MSRVDWESVRGPNRETDVWAFDGVEARATVTRNPDVKRIIAVTRTDTEEDHGSV